MSAEKMLNNMDSIIEFYKLIERTYGIDLTNEVNRANQIKNDIPEAIRKAERNTM